MAGLGGMGNSWAVEMVIFDSYMFCVNVVLMLYDLYTILEKDRGYILSTMYPLSFSRIVYKSYNINTKHITIKNNHLNCPTITHTSQTRHLFS